MAFDIHQIPAMVGVLGFLVFIHELGHFLAAKYFKVKVETFAIGFGPRLFGLVCGGTDYCVRMLPLGGYVKMAGEYPQDGVTGDPAELFSKPRWQRFIIALAGPAMNIVMAVLLLTGAYSMGAEVEGFGNQPTKVGSVSDDSPAAKAGIQRGDVVTEFDGLQSPTWERTITRTMLNAGHRVNATVQRGGQTMQLTITPEAAGTERNGWIGWGPDEKQFVTELEPTMPAAKAGLKLGDEVQAVDNVPLYSMEQLINYLQKSKEAPVNLTVKRGSEDVTLQVQPVLDSSAGATRYRIGARFAGPKVKVALPLGEAWARSVEENKKNTMLLGEVLGGLFKGRVSYRQMSGPLGIMKMTGEAAQAGATPLTSVAASLSLNLGLFNLLPFPILDGGMILFLLIEGIRRKDISLQVKERIYQAAALVLVAFALLITSSDLLKMWHR